MLSDESIYFLADNPSVLRLRFSLEDFVVLEAFYVEKSEGSQLSGRDIFGWFGCLGGHASSGWLLSKPRAVGC